jgi:hypothetical protein
MSVEFQEENELNRLRPQYQGGTMGSGGASGIPGLVIKLGLAKDLEGANKVMTGIAIIAFLLTFFVIFKFIL